MRLDIEMNYQPIVDKGGRVNFYEALLRCRRQDGLLIPPSVVLPLFAHMHRSRDLDREVIEAVGRDAAMLPPFAGISINISALAGCLVEPLKDLADSIWPRQLIVEVSELDPLALTGTGSALARDIVADLQSSWISVAIDDFGAGAIQIQHLMDWRPDIVKLDKLVTTEIQKNPRHLLLPFIRSLRRTGTCVAAEGVETIIDMMSLLPHADLFQGWHLGIPLSASALSADYETGGDLLLGTG